MSLSRLLGSGLAITMPIHTGTTSPADPCPWQEGDNAAACAQWDVMAQRLEAAEARAQAAEQALQAMEGALKSMENTVLSIQQNTLAAQSQQPQAVNPGAAGGTPTDGKEQQARAFVDKLLSYMTMKTVSADIGGFIIDSDYELVQQGSNYTATFQEVALAADEMRVDFGPVVFTIEPLEDGLSHVMIRLGDVIRGREGEDELFSLAIGDQDSSGTWSEKAQNFLNGKTVFKDLKLAVADEDFNASIGSFGVTQNLEIDDSANWQQQQTLALSSMLISGDGNSVSLDAIDGDFAISGSEYFKLINIGNDMQSIIEASADQDQPPQELFDFLGNLFGLFGDYSASLTATNMDIQQQGMPIANIKNLNISGNMTGADDDTSRMGYHIEIDGFDTQMAPLPPNVLPRQARFEIALQNIPAQIMQRFIEIGMASEQMGEEEKDAYFQQQLLGLLMSSNLQFDIIDTFVAATDARFDLNAHAEVKPESAMGGIGNVALKIENMQTLIDISGAAQQQSVAPVLAMITAFSERSEQDGKTIDNFDLAFTADGKLMLNGKDITAMIMPGAGAPPAQ